MGSKVNLEINLKDHTLKIYYIPEDHVLNLVLTLLSFQVTEVIINMSNQLINTLEAISL